MKEDKANRVARDIFSAIVAREPFAPLRGETAPQTLDEAYGVQQALYDIMDAETDVGRIAGHKIALTSPAIQEMCGVDQPVYGAIFEKKIHRSPTSVSLADHQHLGLEFEIAFEMAADVPKDRGSWDADTIAPYVRHCMPAFELIDDRHADYGDLDAISLLTDRCWCGGIVLGEPVTDWQSLDLTALAGTLTWNGEEIDRGLTGAALGNPLSGLAWVANNLGERGLFLREGEVVMTGSALKTRFPVAGDEVIYSVEGLGEVSVTMSS
ncbi:MAG: fumarylacetoacetate hydrolase family protein [Pseudomonadota bacterium]